MAMSIFWLWFAIIISAMSGISLLILVTVQTYHFILNFQKSTPLIVTITNIATILAITFFTAAALFGLAMYCQLTHKIMSCHTFNIIAGIFAFFAMYFKWIVLLLRLKIAFNTSFYSDSTNKLSICAVILLIFTIFFLISLSMLHMDPAPIDNTEWIICGVGVPMWLGGIIAMTDNTTSIICMYVFIKRLWKMFKLINVTELKNVVSKTDESKTDQTQTSETKNNKKDEITDENKTSQNSQDDNADIKQFVKKYALLTSVATVSSMVFYAIMGVTMNGAWSIPDFIFNSYCLALMSRWYDTSNNKCYDIMCCPVIRCVR